MANNEIPNYTNLTCTNLMIKLKILLKKLPSGDIIRFSNREQHDNIKKPFNKKPYHFQGEQIEDNQYLVKILKNSKS